MEGYPIGCDSTGLSHSQNHVVVRHGGRAGFKRVYPIDACKGGGVIKECEDVPVQIMVAPVPDAFFMEEARLLHEEGIGYWCDHDLDRDILTFFDDTAAFACIDGINPLKASTSSVTDNDVVLGMRETRRIAPDRVTLQDYDSRNALRES